MYGGILVNKAIQRFARLLALVPPRHFWPLLIRFVLYGIKQAIYAVRYRATDDPILKSHNNFKRAHYLEKAMYCELPRTPELDANFAALRAYVESPEGERDPNLHYLKKLVKEYEAYPNQFRCFMLEIPFKGCSPGEVRAIRKVIVQRRSIRGFRPEPVEPDLLKQVIDAGRYAPTSCNAQAVFFISITERETIDLVFGAASGARDWRSNIPTGIIVAADRRHYRPFEQHLIMAQDIAAATQNILLMAHALGLATCWVSLVTDMHMRDQKQIYRKLKLPPYVFVGAAIAIGYPASSVCFVPRRPLSDLWFQERFAPEMTSTLLSNKL